MLSYFTSYKFCRTTLRLQTKKDQKNKQANKQTNLSYLFPYGRHCFV